jgi:sugar phosphate isomerase/epimerase
MKIRTSGITCGLLFSALSMMAQPDVGIVQDMERDSLLQASGIPFLSESITKCFSPKTLTDQQFKRKLQSIKRLKSTLVACNLFIPAELKLVGPDVHENDILTYAEVVFQRCRQAGLKLIIWGSGGARRVPEGFDPAKAKKQMIAIARTLAELAAQYDIVLALESINHTETNFINTLAEAYEIVQAVDHPNFRLSADIYHMLKENESPSIIEKAGAYLVHCEIAEKENRTPPGTQGDDFRPYLKALKKIHYKGKIMMECRWGDVDKQAGPAKRYLQKQIDEVFQ